MTYELFDTTYTILHPEWLRLLLLIPLLWLPLFWQPQRGVLFGAVLLRSLAAVLVVAALAGLSRQTIQPEHKLSLVAAVDVSDSIAAEGRIWMKEYLTRLVQTLSPEDEFSALSFAADTSLQVPPGPANAVQLPEQLVAPAPDGQGTETNLAKALERAFALYPEGSEKRLVLLTDGNETNSSSKRHISLARRMGIKIFPVIPPAGQHPEVSLEKFVVPPLVREGSALTLRLVVRNGNDKAVRGSVTVLANEKPLTHQAITIASGLSVLEIPAQISQKGNYLLRAEIKATSDTITGNNRQQATLTVAGKIRALVITDNAKTHLARALRLKEVEVEFRRPEGIPTQLSELLEYNCLVFDDVGRGGISGQQMTVIEQYVRDFGGGFLMAGGMRAFGDLNYKNTTIE
ncbi:MAG: VWA domain-containing protein, partial [Candidatus Binatia bacterium]